jgi:hypothetical protein
MSAADKRVAELVERWMTSVELHARYLALNDADYAKVQDWPKHQRPSRWVIDLARTRLLELGRLLAERQSSHDAGFAEALELMAFLTNLLGSEHVERFIPLAQSQPATRQRRAAPARPAKSASVVEPTVEARTLRPAAAPRQVRRSQPPPTEPRPVAAVRPTRPAASNSRRQAAPAPESAAVADAAAPDLSDKATATVIADAIRLISWGREWPQLAGLIARLANRPAEAEVWKILRRHRSAIEAQVRRPRS